MRITALFCKNSNHLFNTPHTPSLRGRPRVGATNSPKGRGRRSFRTRYIEYNNVHRVVSTFISSEKLQDYESLRHQSRPYSRTQDIIIITIYYYPCQWKKKQMTTPGVVEDNSPSLPKLNYSYKPQLFIWLINYSMPVSVLAYSWNSLCKVCVCVCILFSQMIVNTLISFHMSHYQLPSSTYLIFPGETVILSNDNGTFKLMWTIKMPPNENSTFCLFHTGVHAAASIWLKKKISFTRRLQWCKVVTCFYTTQAKKRKKCALLCLLFSLLCYHNGNNFLLNTNIFDVSIQNCVISGYRVVVECLDTCVCTRDHVMTRIPCLHSVANSRGIKET